MRINEYIKYKRQSLGYSQQQVAELLNVSKQAVSKWEKGTALPDIMIIPALSKVLLVLPKRFMDFIWFVENGRTIDHFVLITVKEKSGESYVIQAYHSENFFDATAQFRKIREGKDPEIMKEIAEYYLYDRRRTVTVELSECIFYDEDEEPKSLLIESRRLRSDYCIHAKSTR